MCVSRYVSLLILNAAYILTAAYILMLANEYSADKCTYSDTQLVSHVYFSK
jgi:hypothetical protein